MATNIPGVFAIGDVRQKKLRGIMVSDDFHELKGVTVNSFQAVELSKLLGLVVK